MIRNLRNDLYIGLGMKISKKTSIDQFINSGNISEIKLLYRHKVKPSTLPQITCSEDVYAILKNVWDWNKIEYVEEFVVLLINRNNRVLGWTKISTGGVSGTVVDPKVIFQLALISNASCIIIAHNHPSGNMEPSLPDKSLTKKIKAAGGLLDINVLDHIIITSESYFSFADDGLI